MINMIRILPFRMVCLGLGALSLAPGQFRAAFNPKVRVAIEHPPGLSLSVEKIVFGPAMGECSDELIQFLISDFVENGVEVIDRQNLDLILSEHDFNFSGYVDQTTAAALGRIIGPSALLSVRVTRCATDQQRLSRTAQRTVGSGDDRRTVKVRIYIARTRAFLRFSVQTVDLHTGRIFAARTINRSPQRSFESEEGYPEYPSEFDVLDAAYAGAVEEIHRMFFPWIETRSLTFFNGKKGQCDLKPAYQALRIGDKERAMELSMANVELCRNDPKVKEKQLSNAYYNAGVMHRMTGDLEPALERFQEAYRLQPKATVIAQAIKESKDAMAAMEAMQRVEESVQMQAEARRDVEALKQHEEHQERRNVVTNSDIIDMVKLQMSQAIIIHRIATSQCEFDLSTEGLASLTQAGVGENVIVAMMDKALQ